jgi:FlaA1/EpsC-like NDP-sugar epimerase
MHAHADRLHDRLAGSRVAVIGAAGSIGSSVAKTLLKYNPAAVALLDLNENNLVEIVRDLRSSAGVRLPADFAALPIGLGTVEFDRYFRESKPFDYLMNLSAIKHVRSEKDIYCLMRMLDTNVLFLSDFMKQMPYRFRKVFSVSSDKAANPANMMGASKMVMEKVLMAASREHPFSTARFANVAFSDGSLPFGFIQRIQKSQPISAPRDIRRFFMSHREAGELCVLASVLGDNRDIFFPKLDPAAAQKTFSEIAVSMLEMLGYEPVVCDSGDEAIRRASELISENKWPCVFYDSDTTGEKDCEEFYEAGEAVEMNRFLSVGVIKQDEEVCNPKLGPFIAFCRNAKMDRHVTKQDYVAAMQRVVPTFSHVERGQNLDQRM